jgi:hypothetical protein
LLTRPRLVSARSIDHIQHDPPRLREQVKPAPQRYSRFAARWLCLWLEEHEKATLEDVELLVSNLGSLATPKDHGSALALLKKAARQS